MMNSGLFLKPTIPQLTHGKFRPWSLPHAWGVTKIWGLHFGPVIGNKVVPTQVAKLLTKTSPKVHHLLEHSSKGMNVEGLHQCYNLHCEATAAHE